MIYPAPGTRDLIPSSNLLIACLSPPDLLLYTYSVCLGLRGSQNFDPPPQQKHTRSRFIFAGACKRRPQNFKVHLFKTNVEVWIFVRHSYKKHGLGCRNWFISGNYQHRLLNIPGLNVDLTQSTMNVLFVRNV